MKNRVIWILALAVATSTLALAQENPPTGTITGIQIQRNLSGEPTGPFGVAVPFNAATDQAREYDRLILNVRVSDVDWANVEPADGEAVYIAISVFFLEYPPSPSPNGPAWPDAAELPFFAAPAQPWGGPPAPPPTVDIGITLQVPKLMGPNQARLLGTIPFDAQYRVVFEFANSGDAIDRSEGPPPSATTTIDVVENPAARPKNPPPSADAGSDKTVEAGTTVDLDGSRTTDSSNTGFDPLDANVIYKDTLVYEWEWISGPERVEPTVRDPLTRPQFAQITLNTIGDYVYRLNVSDGVNALPSSDTVKIKVVSIVPPNRAPNAKIVGPTGNVIIGSSITLDGTGSSDPDGDALTYRWIQTDELGGKLSADAIERSFQPLSGVSDPVASWQAITPGTFYFRLIVNDGKTSSTASTSVTVVTTATAGAKAVNTDAPPVDNDAASLSPALPSTACGSGFAMAGLAPLAAFFATRGRRRC